MQRLCELLTQPKRHYKRVDKFMRGLEKVRFLYFELLYIELLFHLTLAAVPYLYIMKGDASGEHSRTPGTGRRGSSYGWEGEK